MILFDFKHLSLIQVGLALSGQYTETGSGQPAQPFGEHGYDGLQEDWVEETIYLDHLDGITNYRIPVYSNFR